MVTGADTVSLTRRAQNYLPVRAFRFERPLVLFQSDDWGLCGVRDGAGYAALCAAGVPLGSSPYDFHSLETADDLRALYRVLERHHDRGGRSPTFVLNFMAANLDGARALADGVRQAALVPLDVGLPGAWERSGLWQAYRDGLTAGFIYPAYHGLTHFCQRAAARILRANNARGALLRTLYAHDTAQLYSQARWLGLEYYEPDGENQGWLDAATQSGLIQQGAAHFTRMFGRAPFSACAPGYRANDATRRGWAQQGIRVAQNGPGFDLAPYVDASGLLMVYRNVSLEPALHPAPDLIDRALAAATRAAAAHRPIVVCMHAVNFHSTIRNFREATLAQLDEFLTRLQARLPDLWYAHDEDVWALALRGRHIWRGETRAVRHERFWQKSPAMTKRWSHA